jgi:hypothetical protein
LYRSEYLYSPAVPTISPPLLSNGWIRCTRVRSADTSFLLVLAHSTLAPLEPGPAAAEARTVLLTMNLMLTHDARIRMSLVQAPVAVRSAPLAARTSADNGYP